MVKAAVKERARTSQECNDTSRVLIQPLHLGFRKPRVRSLHVVVGFLLYRASPSEEDLGKWRSATSTSEDSVCAEWEEEQQHLERVERVVHIGQKPLSVGKTGITGCGCWAALPLGLRWVKTCYLLFWCQKRAVKAPSQASVTGPDGTSAAYDTN